MNYLKNVGVSLLYIIGIMLVLTFISTFFNYINLFNNSTMSILKIIIPVISMLVGGFIIGKKTGKNGWLEGLKLSLIFIIILTIFNYLGLDQKISLKTIIYYAILIISTIFGSIVGVNRYNPNK